MQGFGAPGEGFRIVLVILRGAGVEIPAKVIEGLLGAGNQQGDFCGRLLFEKVEADHHVRHLHAGVVDIVLHFDGVAESAQHPHEGVAQNGIPQVADVGRLIRIDVGVFDDGLAAAGRGVVALAGEQSRAVRAAVEPHVDVAVAGDFHGGDTGDVSGGLDQFRSDFAGWLLQFFGQLEGDGQGQFAEGRLFGLLNGDFGLDTVADTHEVPKRGLYLLFLDMKHGTLSITAR